MFIRCIQKAKACFFSSFDIEECSLKHLRLNSWDACRGSELGSLWKKSTYWRFKKKAPRVQSWLDKVSLNMSTKYTYITYYTPAFIYIYTYTVIYTYCTHIHVLPLFWTFEVQIPILGSRNASSIFTAKRYGSVWEPFKGNWPNFAWWMTKSWPQIPGVWLVCDLLGSLFVFA